MQSIADSHSISKASFGVAQGPFADNNLVVLHRNWPSMWRAVAGKWACQRGVEPLSIPDFQTSMLPVLRVAAEGRCEFPMLLKSWSMS